MISVQLLQDKIHFISHTHTYIHTTEEKSSSDQVAFKHLTKHLLTSSIPFQRGSVSNLITILLLSAIFPLLVFHVVYSNFGPNLANLKPTNKVEQHFSMLQNKNRYDFTLK